VVSLGWRDSSMLVRKWEQTVQWISYLCIGMATLRVWLVSWDNYLPRKVVILMFRYILISLDTQTPLCGSPNTLYPTNRSNRHKNSSECPPNTLTAWRVWRDIVISVLSDRTSQTLGQMLPCWIRKHNWRILERGIWVVLLLGRFQVRRGTLRFSLVYLWWRWCAALYSCCKGILVWIDMFDRGTQWIWEGNGVLQEIWGSIEWLGWWANINARFSNGMGWFRWLLQIRLFASLMKILQW